MKFWETFCNPFTNEDTKLVRYIIKSAFPLITSNDHKLTHLIFICFWLWKYFMQIMSHWIICWRVPC